MVFSSVTKTSLLNICCCSFYGYMGKTKFQSSWKAADLWIEPVKNDVHQAFGKQCLKQLRIDGSSAAKVKSHAKSHKENKTSISVHISGKCKLWLGLFTKTYLMKN